MQAVILAAGRGSRLEPVTHHVPKPLIPFWGRPFITYLLQNLEDSVERVVVVDNPEGEVRDAVGNSYGSLAVDYTVQHDPQGTGHAVLQTRGMLPEDPFIVLLADTCPPPQTIHELVEAPGAAAVTVVEVDDPHNHGGVDMDEEGRVHALWTDSETVDAGMMRVPPDIYEVLDAVEPRRGEIRIMQAISDLLEAGRDVRAIMMPNPWLQFGDHERLNGVLRVMREIRNGEPAPNSFDGSSVDVRAAEGCDIHNSLVFGPGELINCTISNSMIYCSTRLENVRIDGKMTAFDGEVDTQ